MTTREKIVDMARQEIGISENPPKSNKVKYNDWFYPTLHTYHKSPANWPWCGTFVSYVYSFCGWGLDTIDYDSGFCSVPNLLKWAKKNNKIVDDPKPGDIVVFMWGGKPKHVGIFVSKHSENQFISIEGNTSATERGSQDNGGEVAIKRRFYPDAVFINVID